MACQVTLCQLLYQGLEVKQKLCSSFFTQVMSNFPGWTKWRPGSKCSFSCLVPARGLQMVTRRYLKPKEMCSKKTLKQMRSKKYSNIGPLGVCQANAKGSRPLFKSVKTPAQGLFNVNVKTPA